MRILRRSCAVCRYLHHPTLFLICLDEINIFAVAYSSKLIHHFFLLKGQIAQHTQKRQLSRHGQNNLRKVKSKYFWNIFFTKKKIIRTFRIRPGTSDNQRTRKIGWYVQSLREVHKWLTVLSKRWSSITAFSWLGLVYDSMFRRIRFGKRHLRNVLIVRVLKVRVSFNWKKSMWNGLTNEGNWKCSIPVG